MRLGLRPIRSSCAKQALPRRLFVWLERLQQLVCKGSVVCGQVLIVGKPFKSHVVRRDLVPDPIFGVGIIGALG